MPYTEPNSFGEMTADEWRTAYAEHVREFRESPRTLSDEVILRIKLKILGYAGTNLEAEMDHIDP